VATVVVVAAVVVVLVAGAVEVVVVLADWPFGLLEQPASRAAPIRTAITPPAVALVMPSSSSRSVAAYFAGRGVT